MERNAAIHVLHVDDEPGFADLAATYLERENDRFAVETETSADAGLDRMAETTFDCIVSDYDMPGQDGIEFLETVRQSWPEIPFILFTGKGSEEVASEALRKGATDYLQKAEATEQYELLANRIENSVRQARGQQAERELERRSQAMAEAPIGITMTDPRKEDNPLIYANEAFLEVTGYAREEVIGSNHRRLQGPETEAAPVKEMRRAIEAGESTTVELRNYRKDGELFWNRVSIAPLRDEDGTIVNWVGFQEDVTERKQHEQEIEAVNERMNQALDFTDTYIFEEPLGEGAVKRHGSFERLFGLPPAEISTNEEFYEKCVHPEDRDVIREARSALLAGETDRIDIEFRTHPDRGEVRWIYGEGFVLAGAGGQSRRIIGLDTDITDRKRREEELARLKQEYETVFQNVEESLFMVDVDHTTDPPEFRLQQVNRANEDLLQVSAEAVQGKGPIEIFGEELGSEIKANYERCLDRGEPISYEETLEAAGESRTFETTLTPVEIDGEIERIVGVAHDITDRIERERELERSRVRTDLALRATDSYVFEIDFDSGEEQRFGSWHSIHGIDRDAVPTTESFIEHAVHPDDRPKVRAVHDEIEPEPGASFSFNYRTNPAHGELTWVRAELEVQTDPTDDSLRGVGLATDITELMAERHELERIRDYFTEAEQLGTLGAWEFDETGAASWTDGTRRIHEVDASYEPTVADGIDFYHPDDRAEIRQAIEAALEAGETYDVEARLITAEGNQRWIRTGGKPVDDSGDQRTIRGYIQDVTDQKRREQELRKAKSQLEAAVEAGEIATWVWHVQEDKLVAGPEFARKFGVAPDEARDGVSIERFLPSVHEDDRPRVKRQIDAALEECGSYEAEYRVRNAADERRWVVARGHVECDDDGTPVRFPGAITDITDRKAAEQELRRKNQRLNEFTDVVSHDLQNPLEVAEGYLELAQSECDSEHLGAVERAHDRMRTLIDDLLTLAKEGETLDDVSAVELADLVEACWGQLRTEGATLEAAAQGTVKADASRLRQLFENLLSNAVTHGGPDVTITVGDLENGFYVEDTGPGIPESKRAEVFDPGVSTAEEGTGFGLSIVKRIAEAHGWEINLTEGREGGARFEITGVDVDR